MNTFFSEDRRGSFSKSFSEYLFSEGGIECHLKEVFFAESKAGVLRGIHFQLDKQQCKLVQCIKGQIYDVIVDLNPSSPTYMKWQGFNLNEDNHKAVFVPQYCGHSYYVQKDSLVCYMCDEVFYPIGDSGIRWNDPDINIKWPFFSNPIQSDRDQKLTSLVTSVLVRLDQAPMAPEGAAPEKGYQVCRWGPHVFIWRIGHSKPCSG